MRISIQFNSANRLDIEFGYNTAIFQGIYWFTIIKVYLNKDDNHVEYAVIKFEFLKHYKYWNRLKVPK